MGWDSASGEMFDVGFIEQISIFGVFYINWKRISAIK